MSQYNVWVKRLFPRWRKPTRIALLPLAVMILWTAAMLGVSVRAAIQPKKNTVLTTYRKAGSHWIASENLYKGKRGFVYSPAAAAGFAPVAALPKAPSETLWRLLNAAILLGGVAWWLKAGLTPQLPRRAWPWLFLLLLPLSLGNLNTGQVNPMMIGLIMAAFAACRRERWWIASGCIAIATALKVYPLAAGLLLVLTYPRPLGWRLAVALLAAGLVPFAAQQPAYVAEQYRLWVASRLADDRFAYPDSIAPRDLWVVFRLIHLPIGKAIYQALQVGSALALALLVLAARWQRWSEERLLGTSFALVCGWMLLLGPATESATYIMLAPAVALAFVAAFSRPIPQPRLMRPWIALAVAGLLGALALNSFFRLPKDVRTLSIQPIAALVFCGYTLYATRRTFWADARNPARGAQGNASGFAWALT